MQHCIVLTRPEAKNLSLASSLSKFLNGQLHISPVLLSGDCPVAVANAGVQVLSLPALQLVPLAWADLPREQQALLQNLEKFDAVFCVSSSAAQCFFQLCAEHFSLEKVKRLWHLCVGQASRDYLLGQSIPSQRIIFPQAGHDSEALLAELQHFWHKTGRIFQRVLVVRAQTGRDWFIEQLEQAGIAVDTVAVYQRQASVLSEGQQRFWQDLPSTTQLHWLFTSSESVKALVPALYQQGVFTDLAYSRHHFLVLHKRIGECLQNLLADLLGKPCVALDIQEVSATEDEINHALVNNLMT